MRRSTTLTLIASFGLVMVGCSKKGDDKTSSNPGAAKSVDPSSKEELAPSTEPPGDVGVEAGGIQRDAKEGPAAVIVAVKGTVEVRRIGEPDFKASKAETKLYAGDVIRTLDGSTATIALADESVIELAEVTSVAIANRQASADPASGAAVLAGLARFTVTPRAPGEGAFRVYTPAGVVLTKGTVYGVGVAVSGNARVGVEQGAVDVIGLSALQAEPVAVEGGSSVELDVKGTVASPSPWPADDWGTWRDNGDANLEVDATVRAHSAAMAELDGWIREAYADLDASADSIATFEATAAAAATSGDSAAYQASVPDGAATIDASFSVAGRLEALTWAHSSHATLATELYVRHPKQLEAQWSAVAPRVDTSILWPKRYEVTAVGYLEPLHTQYYVHHPRGRMHAPLVGITVPEFYAAVELPPIDPVRVRGRVKTRIWMAPDVQVSATPRPVWLAAPPIDWRAKAKITPAPFRANVGWYVRPPAMKAKVLIGTPPSATFATKLKVAAPAPRASLRASWRIPVGVKVKVAPPNLDVAAKARASWRAGGHARIGAEAAAQPPAMDARAKVKVAVPDPAAKVKVMMPDVKAGIGVKVRAGADATGGVKAKAAGGAKAAAGVKIKAPEVKIKAPQVKLKGEVKAKVKVGL
ncbi:MAG: FecR domain-containing protein [Kofleriaceae bacterium]